MLLTSSFFTGAIFVEDELAAARVADRCKVREREGHGFRSQLPAGLTSSFVPPLSRPAARWRLMMRARSEPYGAPATTFHIAARAASVMFRTPGSRRNGANDCLVGGRHSQ